MHHFPFHISDFAQATSKFSPEQVGLFLTLLMEYYKTEKPLPADDEELFFLAGAKTPKSKKDVSFIMRRCFVLNLDGSAYHQRRADREIEKYRHKCVHNTYAIVCRHWGKVNRGHKVPTLEEFTTSPGRYYDEATGRIRVITGRSDLVLRSDDAGNTEGLPDGYQPVTINQDPETNNQDTPVVPKGTPSIEALAEAIYILYPKRVGKKAAIKAIVKVLKEGTLTELELQMSVRAYAQATEQWDEQDKTFIPNPATWFNRGSYEDDPATWIRQPAPGAKKERGGGAAVIEARPVELPAAPEGWEEAMEALFGPGWRGHYGAFETLLPVDQRQVRAWLAQHRADEKKEGGAPLLSPWCEVPEDLLAQVWDVLRPQFLQADDRWSIGLGSGCDVEFSKRNGVWLIMSMRIDGCGYMASCMVKAKLQQALRAIVKSGVKETDA